MCILILRIQKGFFKIVYNTRYNENLIRSINSKTYNSTLTEVPCILYDSEGFTFKNFTNIAVFYAAILLGPQVLTIYVEQNNEI